MKEKLIKKLGLLGTISYFVFSLFVSVLPFLMIDAPFGITFLFICIEQTVPLATLVFWIWGLICAVKGVQDIWAIAYYVLFVIMFLPFFFACITDTLQRITLSLRLSSNCKSHVILTGTAVALLLLACVCLYQNLQYKNQIQQLAEQISILEGEKMLAEKTASHHKIKIAELERKLSSQSNTIGSLEEENNTLAKENNFFNSNIVFVPNDNTRVYHKYRCPKRTAKSTAFWIYTVETAKRMGYKECDDCSLDYFESRRKVLGID